MAKGEELMDAWWALLELLLPEPPAPPEWTRAAYKEVLNGVLRILRKRSALEGLPAHAPSYQTCVAGKRNGSLPGCKKSGVTLLEVDEFGSTITQFCLLNHTPQG